METLSFNGKHKISMHLVLNLVIKYL